MLHAAQFGVVSEHSTSPSSSLTVMFFFVAESCLHLDSRESQPTKLAEPKFRNDISMASYWFAILKLSMILVHTYVP